MTATAPDLASTGSGAAFLKRHIVPRNMDDSGLGGPPQEKALCGALWDRLRPQTGEMCEPCVAEFRRRHPGWALPTR